MPLAVTWISAGSGTTSLLLTLWQETIATGASNIGEVQKAVHAILKINKQLVLMQCNTNYTASPNNYDHLHLNVLKTFGTSSRM